MTIVPENQRTRLLAGDEHLLAIRVRVVVVASSLTLPVATTAAGAAKATAVTVAQTQGGQGEQQKRAPEEYHYRVHGAREASHDSGPSANLAEVAELVALAVQLPAHVGVELDEVDALGVRERGPFSPTPGSPSELAFYFFCRSVGFAGGDMFLFGSVQFSSRGGQRDTRSS